MMEEINKIIEKYVPSNIDTNSYYSKETVERMIKDGMIVIAKRLRTWHLANGTFGHTVCEFALSAELDKIIKECS